MIATNNIYHGDCLDRMNSIDNESIDLVITSPPYFNAKEYSKYEYSKYENIEEYMIKMKNIFIQVERVLKKSRICIINISPIIVPRKSRNSESRRIPLPFYIVPMMESIGFDFLEDIIWKKPNASVKNRNGCFYRHRKPIAYKPNIVTEYILVFKKKADFLIDEIIKNDSLVTGDYEKTNVWEINPENRIKHPAPFPEKLVENCLRYYSYEKDIVLDPFAGSGTVGVVCKKMNRKFILIEKERKYVNLSIDRIFSNIFD